MPNLRRQSSQFLKAISALGLALPLFATNVHALPLKTTVTTLHSFDDSSVTNDGSQPDSSLIQASDGNFYGTTSVGGSASEGTIFEYNTSTKLVSILHSFGDGSLTNDGSTPVCALIQASDGNFYGTTEYGGSAGDGTVFEYNASTKLVTILHSCDDGSVLNDGANPLGALLQASDGNLYGTTSALQCDGTIFEYNTANKLVTTLHAFGDGTVPFDGGRPSAALIQALDGNLYGTTATGGAFAFDGFPVPGTIFEYNLTTNVETVLYSFGQDYAANDGSEPVSSLTQATDGNFYGTAQRGGTTANGGMSFSSGTIFEFNPATKVETILHSFDDGSVVPDGQYPLAGLIQGTDGNFYGTASQDTIFEYNPTTKLMSTLVNFDDGSTLNENSFLDASLIQASDGNFYTTTYAGGSAAKGQIIQVVPGQDTRGISFAAGIQMISLPYAYPNVSLDTLFGYTGVQLAVWSPLNFDYAWTPTPPADTISFGEAYWVNFPQQTTISLAGVPDDPTKNFDIPLKAGWNMIGDPFLVAIPFTSLLVDKGSETFLQAANSANPLISSNVYQYTPSTGYYTFPVALGPLQGYWIYAYSNTDVEIPAPSPVVTPAVAYTQRKHW